MKHALLLLALATLGAVPAAAQEDPLARYLYAPEFVFDHQQALGLTDPVRQKIQDAVIEAQRIFVGLQFVMSRETETLKSLLRAGSVDEASVLKQIDQLLGIERELKRTQLSLLIKIKNTLSPEQQKLLDKIREQGGGGPLEHVPAPQRGGEEPLFYVDGVLVTYSVLKAIGPGRIESVEVLKAAAAIARYGPRGAQGVVLVTLKP
jgi:TonB-dependent SusC/RagA subfamily outer membrane receptor